MKNSRCKFGKCNKEKGESQDATKIKDAAFAKIDDWMSEFYAVAKIGLDDNPQLLEALGKTIRGWIALPICKHIGKPHKPTHDQSLPKSLQSQPK